MGKVIYLPEKTGCYRLSPNGAMQTQGRIVVEKNLKIRNYIAKLYFKENYAKKFYSRYYDYKKYHKKE